jgi:hypothetical protein
MPAAFLWQFPVHRTASGTCRLLRNGTEGVEEPIRREIRYHGPVLSDRPCAQLAPDLEVSCDDRPESICRGTQSANLIDSWKVASSSSARSMRWGSAAARAATGAWTRSASKRTLVPPIDTWRANVRFARVPANVQVHIGAPSERDITKFVPEEVGISSSSACSAARARRDRVTVGGTPFRRTERMPWQTSCPRLRSGRHRVGVGGAISGSSSLGSLLSISRSNVTAGSMRALARFGNCRFGRNHVFTKQRETGPECFSR